MAQAAARNVKVFFVSNRTAAEEPATLRNLLRHGIAVDPSGADVLSVGERTDRDDLNDFMSGVRDAPPDERTRLAEAHRDRWGRHWIVLSNPLYGSCERILSRGASGDAEALAKKFNSLMGFK